jgi:hypothetical protein
VQIHEPLTQRCILYPGEAALVPGQAAIPWSHLAVDYAESADTIVLIETTTGVRLLPIRMGPLGPHLMPPIYRILCSLGPSLIPDFSLLSLLEIRLGAEGKQVRHYPRLCHGDVVIMRETWRIPQGDASPPRESGSDLVDFKQLRCWAQNLDLPTKIFVTPMDLSDFVRSVDAVGSMKRLYKPFFVNFDDPWSCKIFHRFISNKQHTITISEMLPGPDQLVFKRENEAYVSEIFLESYGRMIA